MVTPIQTPNKKQAPTLCPRYTYFFPDLDFIPQPALPPYVPSFTTCHEGGGGGGRGVRGVSPQIPGQGHTLGSRGLET